MPGFVPLYIRRHCLLLLYQTLITWMISALALESDSMRSRSSLLRGRTAFSIYRFDNRDRAFVIALFNCITLTAINSFEWLVLIIGNCWKRYLQYSYYTQENKRLAAAEH